MGKDGQLRRRWPVVLACLGTLAVCCAGLAMAWHRLSPRPLDPAQAAYHRGDWGEAGRLAAARLKSEPGDRGALRMLARVDARLGRDARARSLYDRLGGAAQMQAEDFYLLGAIIDRLGNRETARECWIAGLRADPNHPELLQQISLDLLESAKPIQAASFARRLSLQAGWEARGDRLLGRCLVEDDDPVGAVECWSRALRRDPEFPDGPAPAAGRRTAIARALLRINRPSDVLELFNAGGESPADPEVAWLVSRAYLQLGAAERAAAAIASSGEFRERFPLEPEPAPCVGEARCQECHSSIAAAVRASRHAGTFHRGVDDAGPLIPARPIPDPGDRSILHSVERSGGETHFKTSGREQVQSALVEYVFGSGKHGMTMVGHDERGRGRELRLSLYDHGTIWDITTGQSPRPGPGADYLGKTLSADEARSCLFCHTTVARSVRLRTGPESADAGIGCERCHGPGAHHVKAVELRLPDLAIARPGADSGSAVVALCADCHSPLGQHVGRSDPLAPRFPGTGLTWSRCYIESKAALDCITCHDPHRDAETSPAFYERKCLECHAGRRRDRPAASSPRALADPAVCPVNPTRGCVECHMPTVRNAVPHTSFTDHYIRIMAKKDAPAGSGAGRPSEGGSRRD